MPVYGVWDQSIDNDTSPANLQKYGEVMDVEAAYEQDDATASAQFCDGQTSITPPRYANDDMGMLFTYSRETAEQLSGYLRGEIAERVAAGELAFSTAPAWVGDVSAVFSIAGQAQGMAEAVAVLREEMLIPEAVTNSQIEAAVIKFMGETGEMRATLSEIMDYIAQNVNW